TAMANRTAKEGSSICRREIFPRWCQNRPSSSSCSRSRSSRGSKASSSSSSNRDSKRARVIRVSRTTRGITEGGTTGRSTESTGSVVK
ncbi:unnamed protein product, partial [Closterium sp. NIES-53]